MLNKCVSTLGDAVNCLSRTLELSELLFFSFFDLRFTTSNTGSWSFDQRVRGGKPSFMARESFARNVGVTLPTLGDWGIFWHKYAEQGGHPPPPYCVFSASGQMVLAKVS